MPTTTFSRRRRYTVFAPLALLAMYTTVACERATKPVSHSRPVSVASAITIATAVNDPTLDDLSVVAQLVATALQDSTTRMELRGELLANPKEAMIDLQSCRENGVASRMFAISERRGVRNATAMCTAAIAREGLTLYLDPARLNQWDGTTIPLVTAIAHPDRPLADSITVYRSPARTMRMSTNATFDGPIIVILPEAHSSRAGRRNHPTLMRAIPVSQTHSNNTAP
jgi:hypothetical protein